MQQFQGRPYTIDCQVTGQRSAAGTGLQLLNPCNLHAVSSVPRRYTAQMMQPALRVTSVSLAAPDPRELAAFYSNFLGWPVTSTDPARPGFPPEDGWAQIRPPAGDGGPTLNFEYEAGYVAPVWPSVQGQQQLQTSTSLSTT